MQYYVDDIIYLWRLLKFKLRPGQLKDSLF